MSRPDYEESTSGGGNSNEAPSSPGGGNIGWSQNTQPPGELQIR
ncbi:hypothetical protein RBR11_01200 [Microbacterium sp. ASV81]|uniref:Uncharacterized protein n=1 Tax=Microbacterium capsulatum TaxID=3041921 RepID=A0ABU0XBQ6_9MICO|nr:hypothetical protein [Microbacterium sp. ASV81]